MYVVERFASCVVDANRRRCAGYVLNEAEKVLGAVRTSDPLADRAHHDTSGWQALNFVISAVARGKAHGGNTSADAV